MKVLFSILTRIFGFLLADISLQDKMVIYDNEEQQIGWASANCDRLPKSWAILFIYFNILDCWEHSHQDFFLFITVLIVTPWEIFLSLIQPTRAS